MAGLQPVVESCVSLEGVVLRTSNASHVAAADLPACRVFVAELLIGNQTLTCLRALVEVCHVEHTSAKSALYSPYRIGSSEESV